MKTPQTIEEVIQKLDEIIAWSIQNKSTMGYFACTYRTTTIAVLEGVKKKKFEDGPRMIAMDVAFANRYFQALENYQNGRKCTNAWFTSLKSSSSNSPASASNLNLDMRKLFRAWARSRRAE